MFSTANYTSIPNVVKTKIKDFTFSVENDKYYLWRWVCFDIFTFYLIGAKVQLTSNPFYKTLSVNIENSSGNWLSAKFGRAAPLHCFLRGVQASTHKGSHLSLPFGITDIEGYVLTPFNIVDWWMFGCCGRLAEQNTPLALARVLSSFNPHQLLYVALYSRQPAGASLVFNICV